MTRANQHPGQSDATSGLQRWFHERQGKLTRELLLAPAKFGLGKLPARRQPDATTTAVCGYCSTGCGLNIHLKDGQAVALTPDPDYPVNLGMACPKGWEALTVIDAPDRATTPLLKNRQGRFEVVDWDVVMRTFVERFQNIQATHGPESVAYLSTGQIATEEMAYLGALAKFGMGMVHGDGNTRQCMATAVVAYKQSLGFDAPPYTYKDFELSDVIVLVGSNLCIAHPILWERICKNPHQPEIIVIDPRTTETAMAATQHLAIRPKSDLLLFYAIARLLFENDWIDHDFVRQHTVGVEEFRQHVLKFPYELVETETGLDFDQLQRLARTIHEGERVSFWWTMGVNQSYEGVRTAQSIINLALLTGNIGKPGTGANSITGQCNAMGSRLFSNTTNLLGGHDFSNPEHREKVASILGIDESRIPQQTGWAYDQILEGILANKIKGLWVIATNGAHSWVNQHAFRDIIRRLDFLVVQDMYYSTETAQHADLILPAAGWGEKEGTFINSERRIGLIKKVRQAPGLALSDFNIFKLINHYWQTGILEDWNTPEDVFQTLKKLSKDMPCDFSGIENYTHIDEQHGIQWPYPETTSNTGRERRLFEDGRFYHSDGKARFLFESPRPMPELPNADFPFLLLTGRGSASQWHTQTRTAKSSVLQKLHSRDVYAEINPEDAHEFGIMPNAPVRVVSQRGRITVYAVLTHSVRSGQVFIPMHYEATNQLTDSVFDPYSRQPSYKACAVRLEPLKWAGS